ncbi:hypothetical protein D3H64_05210 [Atopobacter sp. AH10]|uniref:hypothetical protein n=1 Tax=Atopobacter sp. AH10 TaxID=2315861 RepID=UPI000EF19E33|nr:hypothetical protein [Atopobacter sp. AH10]RLK63380.1 hypothetical protein D3H64_05210 [Atopobacter sp. AH10]
MDKEKRDKWGRSFQKDTPSWGEERPCSCSDEEEEMDEEEKTFSFFRWAKWLKSLLLARKFLVLLIALLAVLNIVFYCVLEDVEFERTLLEEDYEILLKHDEKIEKAYRKLVKEHKEYKEKMAPYEKQLEGQRN